MPWYREFIKKGHMHFLGINCKLNFDKMHTKKTTHAKKNILYCGYYTYF